MQVPRPGKKRDAPRKERAEDGGPVEKDRAEYYVRVRESDLEREMQCNERLVEQGKATWKVGGV